jgi:adsorption protein B
LINDSAESADFIQTPVFSFDVPLTSWVRGTYVDEFSESHTKDLLVRERLGAAIPSAGVGTALSRRLVLTYMKKGAGALLREDTLTEDYDLGLRTKALGFRSKFVCAYRRDLDGNPDYIATREFFPGRLKASIRQKTRWTLGIAFQGRDQFGWDGDLVDKYFLFRDRRGPLNSILIVFGLTTVMGFSGAEFSSLQLPAVLHGSFFVTLAAANGFNMVIRILQRARAVYRVHGLAQVAGIPIRWPVGSIINLAAASNAYFAHRMAQKTGQATKWEKTLHELPANFGQVAALQGKAMNLSTVQMEQQRSL